MRRRRRRKPCLIRLVQGTGCSAGPVLYKLYQLPIIKYTVSAEESKECKRQSDWQAFAVPVAHNIILMYGNELTKKNKRE